MGFEEGLEKACRKAVVANAGKGLEEARREADATETGKGKGKSTPMEAHDNVEADVVHTGERPLSMYDPPLWAMCFPDCFPYGDGVFGLPRETPLTFQQWTRLLFLREELEYSIDEKAFEEAASFFESEATGQGDTHGGDAGRCSCRQCAAACDPFTKPMTPRWQKTELICVAYDSYRRMAQIRAARAHVRRQGYKPKLTTICNATSEKIEDAIRSLGENASVRDVLRSPTCDHDLKEALSELMIFTSDVVGSDGARAKLRHEQNGYALMFGPAGGFLTPNMSDVRSPLVVTLHGGGVEEHYTVDLQEERRSDLEKDE